MKPEDVVLIKPDCSNAERAELPMISLEERKTTFKEVALTMSKETIMKEGERCIECSCTAKSDCQLKKHSESCGACPTAIKGEKLKAVYDNRHPVIMHDRGKCIKCGICVKVCKEVVNQSLLSPQRRGYFTFVSTAFNKGLPLSCADCMACAKECPVGALDLKSNKQ